MTGSRANEQANSDWMTNNKGKKLNEQSDNKIHQNLIQTIKSIARKLNLIFFFCSPISGSVEEVTVCVPMSQWENCDDKQHSIKTDRMRK